MALTSPADSLSTDHSLSSATTDNHRSFVFALVVWLAALAVWFWHDFEVPVAGKHLIAITAGVGTLLGILFTSTLLLVVAR